MSSSLRLQTLALLGQEFLARALARGGSLNDVATEALLKPRPLTGREMSAVALTGKIRSDSAMLHQASHNASEASAMASMIRDSTFLVSDTLNTMLTIAQAVNNGEMNADEAAKSYNSLASSLKATITGTAYNGIVLLDKDGWGSDARETSDASGTSGTLHIQMGNASSAFMLRDLSNLKAFAAENDLSPASIEETIDKLSSAIGTANTMSSGYEALASSYEYEARHFTLQGDNLALVASRGLSTTPGNEKSFSEESVRNLLLDMLLRDQGKLVDTES